MGISSSEPSETCVYFVIMGIVWGVMIKNVWKLNCENVWKWSNHILLKVKREESHQVDPLLYIKLDVIP